MYPCLNLKDYVSLWHIEATGAGGVSSSNNEVAVTLRAMADWTFTSSLCHFL
jgi:hypothetical protein